MGLYERRILLLSSLIKIVYYFEVIFSLVSFFEVLIKFKFSRVFQILFPYSELFRFQFGVVAFKGRDRKWFI